MLSHYLSYDWAVSPILTGCPIHSSLVPHLSYVWKKITITLCSIYSCSHWWGQKLRKICFMFKRGIKGEINSMERNNNTIPLFNNLVIYLFTIKVWDRAVGKVTLGITAMTNDRTVFPFNQQEHSLLLLLCHLYIIIHGWHTYLNG